MTPSLTGAAMVCRQCWISVAGLHAPFNLLTNPMLTTIFVVNSTVP